MEKLYRYLGIRPRETKTVWLFFAHNFLLGIGTILVYVTANVLLLEENPERNLPLAYCVGALAMIAVGKIYAFYEHRLPLNTLAVRVLLASVVLTLVLGLLLLRGPSVTTAVAIMTGYRLIYLLTNLEFWGMSAVVFNVRQGRRLFSIISSGDMPAKALGAILAVFIHAYNELYVLLLLAFGADLLALFIQRTTFSTQNLDARQGPPRVARPEQPPLLRQLLGASPLIRAMGLSLTAIAAVAVGVEYVFFVNVKDKLQDQTTILQYVGGFLGLTYLLAMVFKLLISRHSIDRLGVRWTLVLLPLTALGGIMLYGVLRVANVGPAELMLYFGGLYLVLEVLRRTLFEPVYLVLFQPLTPAERLEGHTLAKGFYEPLGLGLGGLFLLSLHETPALNQWVPFLWMGLLLLAAVFLLQRTYWKYLDELKDALGLRFTADARPDLPPSTPVSAQASKPGATPEEALHAVEYLQKAGAATLLKHATDLLGHADSRVRNRVLNLVGQRADVALLRRLALTDSDPVLREMASQLAGRYPEADDLLSHPDLAVRKGALRGRLKASPTDAPALASLAELAASPETSFRLVALALVDFLSPDQQLELITTCQQSSEAPLVQAAIYAAAKLPTPALTKQLISHLSHKAIQKPAAASLVQMGDAVLPPIQEALTQEIDGRRVHLLAQVCAHQATAAARRVLVAAAQGANLHARAAALRALSNFATDKTDSSIFQRLVEKEMRLAQHLLHGMMSANAELRSALRYELRKGQQRLFGLLMQVYERQPIMDAQRGVAHSAGERQANALEILDNLIPRPLYQGLQALLDAGRLSDKVRVFDGLLGPLTSSESIQNFIVRQGTEAFSAWTISVALRQWHPQPAIVEHLYQHLDTHNLLIKESALLVLRQLPVQRPAAYDQLVAAHPAIATLLMTTPETGAASARERVLILKATTLFAETPENVLGSIVPIMKEVTFEPEQEIFVKGTLGNSLFIMCEGEVGIYDGPIQLTTFHKGEFFGELALLDAEARSATAVALGRVVAFRIDQEDFYDVMEECSEVARNIMRVLCQRLRKQNEKMLTETPA